MSAEGSGCTKAFVCGYHGWAYRLDGRLHHIPHDQGFPDVDKADHGLVPVPVEEKCGLVFVTQIPGAASEGALDGLPDLISSDQRIFAASENVSDVRVTSIRRGPLIPGRSSSRAHVHR